MKYLLALSLSALTMSCSDDGGGSGSGPCEDEARADEYVAGIEKVGANGYTVKLMASTPAPPQRNFDSQVYSSWNLEVKENGTVTEGLTVEATTWMPDHNHGGINSAMTDDGNGMYTLDPIDLFMLGYWEVTIALKDDTETELDSVTFKFCVAN